LLRFDDAFLSQLVNETELALTTTINDEDNNMKLSKDHIPTAHESTSSKVRIELAHTWNQSRKANLLSRAWQSAGMNGATRERSKLF